MFVHNIDPVLFSIGPISIYYYGLVYVLGFVLLYFLLRRVGGFSEQETDSLLLYLIAGMFLGARSFFFLFYHPDHFSVMEFFAVWKGGMSFHGGFLGLTIAVFVWAKRNNHDPWRIADLGALIAGSFLFLGRIANFINAEIVGTLSNASWCVQFPYDEGCRHPVQLYAAVKNALIQSLVYFVYRSGSYASGFIFWVFALLYGVLRFIVNFYRDDPILALGWLKMGQVLSLVLVVVSLWALFSWYRDDLSKLFKKNS